MALGTMERDAGLRLIARTTRRLAAGTLALTGALTVFVWRARPGSSAGSSNRGTAAAADDGTSAESPATTPAAAAAPSPGSFAPSAPEPVLRPRPRPLTRTGGS
jgi:hypothetical protein